MIYFTKMNKGAVKHLQCVHVLDARMFPYCILLSQQRASVMAGGIRLMEYF